MAFSLSKLEISLLVLLLLMTILATYLFILNKNQSSLKVSSLETIETKNNGILKEVEKNTASIGTATSGKLFKGQKIASYSKERMFNKFTDLEKQYSQSNLKKNLDPLICEKWSVVTTIFEPSAAVKKQATIPGWCLVVVGDKKGPLTYEIEDPNKIFIFLTAEKQEQLGAIFPIVKSLPWNHFGRKNVGYLYAILHGAKTIWDFDDDNIIIAKHHSFTLPGSPEAPPITSTTHNSHNINSSSKVINISSSKVITGTGITNNNYVAFEPEAGYESLVLNPYPLMGANVSPCWPRGFPLERIISNSSSHARPSPIRLAHVTVAASAVGIMQSLANHDPDVDAIYRLTQPLPFDFPIRGGSKSLLVPLGSYAPYNAQATMHLYSSLWSLLLPVTVHGRVSDIWRGYFAQVPYPT
jgi:hypothetical protein